MLTTHTQIPKLGLGLGIAEHRKIRGDYRHYQATIEQAITIGYRFFDTAPVYGLGDSEKCLGKALKNNPRHDYFIASKVSPDDLSRSALKRSLDNSLHNLQREQIDLLQIHWSNPEIPIGETMQACAELISAGKIKHVGVCNFSLTELQAAVDACTDFTLASLQMEYNLLDRGAEQVLLPFCEKNNIQLLAYSPLIRGQLVSSSKQRQVVEQLANKYTRTPAQIILNYLMSHSSISCIPNTSSQAHLVENYQALSFSLEDNDMAFINEQCRPPIRNILPYEIELSAPLYQTLEQARANANDLCPSPIELAETIRQGDFLKPIYLKEIVSYTGSDKKKYQLLGGQLRYWAWVIAFGCDQEIPALLEEED